MASQGDIRAFESEQERRSALPPPAALSAPSLAPAPARAAIPLGVQLPKIVTTSEAMDKAVTGMLGQQQALNERLPALQAQVEQRRSALSGELDRPMPAAPTLQDIPQFRPREISGEELTLFAGVAMALAGLGTKAMRGDLTMALNAAGNAMKGFNEGNLQQSKLDLENFKRQMDSVIAQNHKMSEEYRAILENRKLSLQQKDQMLRVAAAARDDQIMLSALQSGQLKTVFDLEAHRITAANQAAIQSANMYNTAAWHQSQAEQRMQIAQLQAQRETLKPVARPDGSVVYVPTSEAVGQAVPQSSQNRPPPAEIMRMNVALGAMAKALDNYEALLKNFDPRSWDQLSPENRAKIESAVSALQLEWKEAAALGALTGPDLEIMERTIVSPSSMKGAYYGKEGLTQQIGEGRGWIKRRQDSIRNFYPNIDKAGGMPGAGVQSFPTEVAARAAGVKPGTRVIINGVAGTWQD